MPIDNGSAVTIILLMNQVRRVSEEEARRVVSMEVGLDVGESIRVFGDNSQGMTYMHWRAGDALCNIGTSSDPYPEAAKWWTNRSMREPAPKDQECLDALMAHAAFLYVDAIVFGLSLEPERHLANTLRIASHFVDERCLLVWYWSYESKLASSPTTETIAAMRAGRWPD